MSFTEAKSLLGENIYQMNIEELGEHHRKVTTAWRNSKGIHGIIQGVRDGFYVLSENGTYIERDIWLSHNLYQRIIETQYTLNKLREEAGIVRKDNTFVIVPKKKEQCQIRTR